MATPETQYTDVAYGVPSPMIGGQFDPGAYIQNYGNAKRELELKKLDREAQNRKAFRDQYDPSKMIPKDGIYDFNRDAIEKNISEYGDYMAERDTAMDDGRKSEAADWYKKAQSALISVHQDTQRGKDIQNKFETYGKLIEAHPEKYNIEDFYKWKDNVLAQPDIASRHKYANENSPINEKVDLLEEFGELVDPSTFETPDGVTTTKLDRNKVIDSVNGKLLTMDAQKRKQYIDALITLEDPKTGKPLGTDLPTAIGGFVDNVVMPMGKESITRVQKTGGSGSGGSASEKLSFSVSQDGTTGLIQDGKPNKLRVNRTGTQDDLPAIGVTDDSGKLIDFQPIEFIVGDNGKIGVKGYKVEKGGGGTKINADGSVQIGGSASQPEEVWIDYDSNKDAFKAQLLGEDIYEKLGRTRSAEKQSESAPKMSEAEWSASWSKLKPGESMMGLDGKKYVKK